MRTSLTLAGLALVATGLPFAAEAQADGETCQGKAATIVQEAGDIQGTDGDDVIVGGAGTRVRAGKGDDIICVTGNKVQGGQGRDSVEMRGGDEGGNFILVDVERVDVETGAGHDSVFLEWSDFRGEHVLAGRIDGRDGDDRLWVTGARDISVVLPREKLRLAPGVSVDVSGFESAFAVAWRRGRVVGDAGDNALGVAGCRAHVLGGSGNDDISYRYFGPSRNGCDGLRAKGQGGDDVLHGTPFDDLLDGGAGVDRALGGRGLNRCPRVEHKRNCS